jgi:3-deoxy-D-manno-octulosonic-acid transferase
MRLFLYNSLLFILLPFMVLRLFFKSVQDKDYIKNISNRFGFFKQDAPLNLVWFHAVSLGEVISSQILVKKLLKDSNIVLSVSTPTGLREAEKIYGDAITVVYAPWDFIFFVNRFIKKFKPKALILFETEIWPSMIHAMRKSNKPVILSNARLSESSFKKYRRVKFVIKKTLSKFSLILAQSFEHVDRFKNMGVKENCIIKVGSTKFDFGALKNSEASAIPNDIEYILAASTHIGEDEIIIKAYEKLKKEFDDLKLIIVPRHPERAIAVKEILKNKNVQCAIDSYDLALTIRSNDVTIIDTTGKLNSLYERAKVSFIGGSLISKYGGHNIIEPAYNRSSFIVGPHMRNFKDILNLFLERNACLQLDNPNELFDGFKKLLNNDELRNHMIDNAYKVVDENKGSSNKQYNHIKKLIK